MKKEDSIKEIGLYDHPSEAVTASYLHDRLSGFLEAKISCMITEEQYERCVSELLPEHVFCLLICFIEVLSNFVVIA